MDKRKYFVLVGLLAIILLLNILMLFKKDGAWKLEEIKVGGSQNLEKVMKFYKSDMYIEQQTMAIDQALEQANITDNSTNNNVPEENDETKNQIVLDELAKIKESSPIYGEESARFTILEYSELLCSYCKKHSDEETLESVIKKYPNEVNTIHRNYIVHAQAAKLGEVVLCVEELDAKSQHNFVKDAFANNATSVESLVDLAVKMGINKQKLQSCVDSGKYTEEVNNQTNEGRSLFGINGTPGNVIIDGDTGRFAVVNGAYPVEKFVEEIEKLKNN